MFDESAILDIVDKTIFKTVGCTEPMAIALAVVVAYKEILGEIKSVAVSLDKNVYKNALAVGIPGTGYKGPKMAIALGLIAGDPEKGLLLLENVSTAAIIQAQELLSQNLITITLNEAAKFLNIQATIETTNGKAKAIISQCHDNIVLIEKNGEVIYHRIVDADRQEPFLDEYDFSTLQFDALTALVNQISAAKIVHLEDAYKLNYTAALIGLEKNAGMGLGACWKKLIDQGTLENAFTNRVKMIVAAAADARMGGLNVPILGCTGSGNHGITFFLTIGMCFQHFEINPAISLAHAYVYGLVILAAIKQRLGLLSSICGGAIAAGAAAAGAIVYMLGGNSAAVTNAINLVIGNIAGIVCDGAKNSCALKVSTGAALAVEAALLSLADTKVSVTDGIIAKDFYSTLINLGILSKSGMKKLMRRCCKYC